MRTNYKFHAIAIATISLVITVIYTLVGPAANDDAPKVLTPADTYVRVISATWGRNCNQAIEQAKKERESQGLAKDEEGNVIPMPILRAVQTDNVLTVVDALCSKQIRCELRPDPETMGADPMPDCFKKLEATFRCTETDRVRSAVEDNSAVITLDCSTVSAPNASPAAQ
jgi:hypothetical protein